MTRRAAKILWAALVLVTLRMGQATAAPPPLTQDELTALETVEDGKPIADDAGLAALLGNIDRWTPDSFHDSTVPPLDANLAQQFMIDPAAHRGELVTLTGTQPFRITAKALAYPDVEAWQVKIEGQTGVALVLIDTRSSGPIEFDGAITVTLPARFLKTITTGWPADPDAGVQPPDVIPLFVGAQATFTFVPSTTLPDITTMVLLVLSALAAFVVLRLFIKRGWARLTIPQVMDQTDSNDQLEAELPDDPIEALAELRRRADNNADHARK